MIGSDPGEYSRDFETIMKLMADSTPEGDQQIRVLIGEIRGYEEGDIGWSDATGHFEHDGVKVPVRITDVARREDGVWRSVQSHASIGVPVAHMFDPMFTGGPPRRREGDTSRRGRLVGFPPTSAAAAGPHDRPPQVKFNDFDHDGLTLGDTLTVVSPLFDKSHTRRMGTAYGECIVAGRRLLDGTPYDCTYVLKPKRGTITTQGLDPHGPSDVFAITGGTRPSANCRWTSSR